MSLICFLFSLLLGPAFGQDIKITPEMYAYSPYSITGVYVCTPAHVANGDCSEVDKEYFDNLARISLGVYEIGILLANNEKTIAFKGPLSPGAADNLINILKRYPEIKTLTLSSQGGSEEEAYKIVDYIRQRKMKTWIPVKRLCLSACVAIFLSGEEKNLDGQLGLHTGEFYFQDSYQIRNLETAKKTIDEAMYQNNIFMMKRVKMFLDLKISLELIEAMIDARGKFLVFTNIDDLFQYNPRGNYIRTFEEMSEFAKNQSGDSFLFQAYEQLF